VGKLANEATFLWLNISPQQPAQLTCAQFLVTRLAIQSVFYIAVILPDVCLNRLVLRMYTQRTILHTSTQTIKEENS
jgi:hypothetical protein